MTDKIIKYTSIALIAFLLIFGSLWYFDTTNKTENNKDSDYPTVNMVFLGVVQTLPHIIAVEEGWFDQADIDINVEIVNSPIDLANSVITGQADMGVANTIATGIAFISESNNPDQIGLFSFAGGDSSIRNDVFLTAKDSPYNSVSDLRGEEIVITTLAGAQWDTLTKEFIKINGLDEDDVTISPLPIPEQISALTTGQADVALTLEPLGLIGEQNGLTKSLQDSPVVNLLDGKPFYGAAGAVNLEFADNNPELVAEIIDIYDRAQDALNENPEPYLKYLEGNTSISDELVTSEIIPTYRVASELNESDLEGLQALLDMFEEYYVIKQAIKIDDILYIPEK